MGIENLDSAMERLGGSMHHLIENASLDDQIEAMETFAQNYMKKSTAEMNDKEREEFTAAFAFVTAGPPNCASTTTKYSIAPNASYRSP